MEREQEEDSDIGHIEVNPKCLINLKFPGRVNDVKKAIELIGGEQELIKVRVAYKF